MIHSNVDFFNVAELRPTSDGGFDMIRFPESAYRNMRNMGSKMAHTATCTEIRFVTDSDVVWVTLMSKVSDTTVYLYSGDYKREVYSLQAGAKKTLVIEPMSTFRDKSEELLDSTAYRNRYSHKVYRIVIPDAYMAFYDIKALNGTFLRAPNTDELPKKRMLMYGSSISHGCWSQNYTLGYVGVAAEKLGLDLLNKGMSGSSRFEKETADYLAGEDFDIALFELATNMTNPNDYTVDEIVAAVDYTVRTVCEKNPDKLIICMSPFCHLWNMNPENERDSHKALVKSKIDELIASYGYKNLRYFDSELIFDKAYYCCWDFCHPSDFGHIRMGENLASILTRLI